MEFRNFTHPESSIRDLIEMLQSHMKIEVLRMIAHTIDRTNEF